MSNPGVAAESKQETTGIEQPKVVGPTAAEQRKPSLSGKVGSGVSRDGELPEMLTARDLEALLKIDVKTIYSYVQQGLIPYVRIQSKVRFDKREIVEWIAARRYAPKSARRDNADAS